MIIIKSFVGMGTAQSPAIKTQTGRAMEMVFMCLGSWIYNSSENVTSHGVCSCVF